MHDAVLRDGQKMEDAFKGIQLRMSNAIEWCRFHFSCVNDHECDLSSCEDTADVNLVPVIHYLNRLQYQSTVFKLVNNWSTQ